jgi:hypothetical protein
VGGQEVAIDAHGYRVYHRSRQPIL